VAHIRFRILVALLICSSGSALAQGVQVTAPTYAPGARWSVVELDEPSLLPRFEPGWQRSTFWDLRPLSEGGRIVRWSVTDPHTVGLGSLAENSGADLALCAMELPSEQEVGCRLIASEEIGPTGPRALWSALPGETAEPRRVQIQMDSTHTLIAGASFTDRWLDDEGVVATVDGVALAEGIALTPAGPAEVILLRETVSGKGGTRTVFRFVEDNGRTIAEFDAELGIPVRGSILAEADRFADDGIEIDYETLSSNLQVQPTLDVGHIGFLQYSMEFTGIDCFADVDCGVANGVCIGADLVAVPPVPGACQAPLTDLRAGWTTINDALSIDQTGVLYQPDPGDGSSAQTLPEVWEFATLKKPNLLQRTFNTIRSDTVWSTCLESCAVKNTTALPPDGTWQAYLKIDNYDSSGAFLTRDIFTFNDNDTGANPSIDVPLVVQDQANASDRTQICFEDSGGAAGSRLLNFFQFTGPDPASAVLGVGDIWDSGNWTSCNDGSGLHLTLASVCGDACYPACPDGTAAPRAQGLLTAGGAGLRGSIDEDGFLHVAAGNYVPALLLLQETDLEAGADLFGTCNVGTQRLRGIDWFWLHERYGLLALISGVNDDGTNCAGNIQPKDWSCFGDRTDGADFTWGPFPPYEIRAEACLNGTKIEWELPADGSTLEGEPGIKANSWGHVVSWGTENDPDLLADWDTNPNHTPLPGELGYLVAPAPGPVDPSYVITGFAGTSINATVTTALTYQDPDVLDETSYRSAAFYRVVEDPAKLDPGVFQVGNAVAPFVAKLGTDLDLSWPAVGGASGYSIKVWDLDTDLEIACPAGLDCAPATTSTTFSGAGTSTANYGFRVFAVDSCGDASSN